MSTQEDREWWAHEDRISDDQDERTVCHRCSGWGRLKGAECDECNGTGHIDPNDYEMEYDG